jgi:hypothetical protein
VSFIGKSHEKVQYELRPAKQVERRMLLHTFHELRDLGYSISTYEYTGLGSIYFVDFVLFHRYLGLTRMTSVEGNGDVKKRVKFNRPYKLINLVVPDEMSAQIARLSSDRRHILWLDFDSILTKELLNTVHLAAMQLSVQSILLVTVDVEPPGRPEDGPMKWNPTTWMRYYREEVGAHFWRGISKKDFARLALPTTNARIIQSVIDQGLRQRDAYFIGMFSFLYADGHRMLSVGGMIGSEEDRRKIRSLDRDGLFFMRDNITDEPFLIRVPLITRKERHYLDQNMPCSDNWSPSAFEMKPEDIQDYKKIYRYYPAYTEMLL